MTQPRNQAPATGVSVFDTGGSVQPVTPTSEGADATGGAQGPAAGGEGQQMPAAAAGAFGPKVPPRGVPVSRGPYDCWHSETYLIGWLVKGYGWHVVAPGHLIHPNLEA